eukprot:SAG11_NODE_1255_length_5375_cov_2.966641_7_plen_108_part_00
MLIAGAGAVTLMVLRVRNLVPPTVPVSELQKKMVEWFGISSEYAVRSARAGPARLGAGQATVCSAAGCFRCSRRGWNARRTPRGKAAAAQCRRAQSINFRGRSCVRS